MTLTTEPPTPATPRPRRRLSELGAAAVELARHGMRVVPLHAPTGDSERPCTCGSSDCSIGKHPRHNDWPSLATTDRGTITGWWEQWPNANIGIAMGGGERLIALDLDGPAALDTIEDWRAQGLELPETLTARSGRLEGGEHRIFRVPVDLNAGRIRNAVGTSRSRHPGIDVRASGGQIVAPPSLHASGRVYTWSTPKGPAAPITELPGWLFDLLTAPRAPAMPPTFTPDVSEVEAIRRASAYLARVPGAIAGQRGGTATFVAAQRMVRGFGLSQGAALDLLWREYNPRCVPAWTHADLARKVAQADTEGTMARGALLVAELPTAAPATPPPPAAIEPPPPDPPPDEPDDDPEPEDPGDWQSRLLIDSKGKIVKCTPNAITILSNDPLWKDVLQWNVLLQTIVTTKTPPWSVDEAPNGASPGEWQDADTVRVQAWLHRRWGLHIGREASWDAVRVVAERRTVDPIADWLDGLRWDGTRRVDTWLTTYAGAEATPYVAAVGRMFLVSAVARAKRPGCKVDTMVVLEGPQGAYKSTLLRTLFGDEWFCDTPLDLESKDRFVQLRGRWCVEMAELDSLRKTDSNRIKSFLSSATDSYRPPYGRGLVTTPRRVVFGGTTNAAAYLRDETGNRRFWPIVCGMIDIEAASRDRDQLWAEAHEMFLGGATWWPDGELAELCRAQQLARVQGDAWQPLVDSYLDLRRARVGTAEPRVSLGDVLQEAVKLDPGRWSQQDQNRAARCITISGWARAQRREAGKRVWVYVPSDWVSPVSPVESVESFEDAVDWSVPPLPPLSPVSPVETENFGERVAGLPGQVSPVSPVSSPVQGGKW